ncbi:MAG TPA: DUF5660 family protein [Patescibacteria group bacterium]|nr:DUF5660 family protein [Patescibacteria group bacterium]
MKKKITHQTQDSFEAVKELPGSVKKSIVEDLGKGLVSDLWEQLLNPNPKTEKAKSGDLKMGEELDLREKKLAHVEPGIDYSREIVHAEKRIHAEAEHETKVRIQEILIEIKKLTNSSKELEVQFKDIAVEQIPQEAGKYHANFVEWVLSMIRSAQERVDSAVSWTAALKGKKNQKQYWSLFKKHGTTFGLSGERVVATQVG